MVKVKAICNILILSFFTWDNLVSQPADYIKKREIINLQLERLTEMHDSVFNRNRDIINGKLFYSGGNMLVHPFLGDNSWSPAFISSSGHVYEMKMTKYDLYLDYPVILDKAESFSYPIYLNKESVKEFTIYGHHFKYMEDFKGSVIDVLVPGYYEELYNGRTKFIVRRVKLKKFDEAELSDVYSDRIYFFLKKNDKYIRIIRQGSLIKALNDHKKEIKTFMKKNHLRFSQDNYEDIVKVLEYYDSL